MRPAADGGRVVVLADSEPRPVQALLRWDPAGAAERELADRRRLRFPPAVTMAALRGPPTRSRTCSRRSRASCPRAPTSWGPRRTAGTACARSCGSTPPAGSQLAAALKAGQAVRSARKAADFVTVTVDPADLG